MRPIKWFVGAAIGAMLLAPGFAKADLQYVYVSGNFAVTSNSISGTETVNLLAPGGSPTLYTNATLQVAGSNVPNPPGINGVVKDSANNVLFNFSGGQVSTFIVGGNNALFAVTGVKYSSIALGIQPYIPLNSSGSFTGSTTAWNGMTGKFNGQFSASTPELGSSVAMATMLLGAGFLGFRKRR